MAKYTKTQLKSAFGRAFMFGESYPPALAEQLGVQTIGEGLTINQFIAERQLEWAVNVAKGQLHKEASETAMTQSKTDAEGVSII